MSSILQKIININIGGFPRRRRGNPPQSKKSKYCKMSTYWGCRKINFLVSLATASLYKIIKSEVRVCFTESFLTFCVP